MIKEAEDKVCGKSRRRYDDSGPSNSGRVYKDHRSFRHADHEKDDRKNKDEKKSYLDGAKEISKGSFRKPVDFDEYGSEHEKKRDIDSKSFRRPNTDRYNERLERLKSDYRDASRSSWKKTSSESSSSVPRFLFLFKGLDFI